MINYDQIDEEVTRLVNAISQGGGGGGSTVSVVSKRNTGENIADITVNGATTQLYAPDSASDISFDPTVKGVYSGTNTQSVVDEITDDITSLNDTINNITSETLASGCTLIRFGKLRIASLLNCTDTSITLPSSDVPTQSVVASSGYVNTASNVVCRIIIQGGILRTQTANGESKSNVSGQVIWYVN